VDGDFAHAVARFQDVCCSYSGWPSPTFALKKIAAVLTEVLLRAKARHLPDTECTRSLLTRILDTPIDKLAEQEGHLEPIWDLLANAREKFGAFGEMVLGTMLNAAMYRVQHPGEFAVPHKYVDRLAAHFPLPIVVLEGEYYLDENPGNSVSIGWPYLTSALELAHDCIGLMTLKPLRSGEATCGFIEDRLDCWYVRSGLGCPQKSLTPKQQQIRLDTKLDDWCHWTARSIVVETAPPEMQKRWDSRISSAR
jgi:hypothetical protein